MKKKHKHPDKYFDQFDGEENAEWFAAQDVTYLERQLLGIRDDDTTSEEEITLWRLEMERQKAQLLGKK
jgi:hypothetical protein